DGSGLIFGGISHGLAIDDSTFYNNVPLGSSYISWLTVPSGPLNTPTQTSFGGLGFDFLPDVYFGGVFAQSSLTSGTLTSTAPPSSKPGPVNIKMEFSNGSEGFKAWGFTYGPWIQVADGSGADASGGASASIVGMGLGTDSSKVQVSVGGTSAQVTGITQLSVSSGLMPIYPYASSIVTYVVPPGLPGLADIVVTTPDGNNTLQGGMRYSQIEDYSSADTLTAVLYDRTRNRLYLTAGDHIDLFNLATSTFGAPITPPNLNGKSGFAGLALTPDGSKLLVTNQTDGSLAVVNPDSPSSATVVSVVSPQITPSCILGPWKVAATSDNRAIIALLASPSGCTGGGMYAVNLATGISTPFSGGNSCGDGEAFASRDGSKLVISPPQGSPCLYDVATGSSVPFGSGYATTTAIAGDGTFALSTAYSSSWDIADASGSVVGHSSVLDVLAAGLGMSSAAMNDSGSLMYLANAVSNTPEGTKSSAYVDVIDAHHSDVRSRIRLSENIQSVITPMAVDPSDARVFLITDKGLTVITVSGVPLSLASVTPGSVTVGTVISVRGSGFQPGMTAKVNGIPALVLVTDSQTAQVTVPSVSTGAAMLSVTNPDGQTYSLEAAFRVN
ncbi:MAG TPA: IPT/TIG domain-containing protein, partial [Chloroflexota bacterium]